MFIRILLVSLLLVPLTYLVVSVTFMLCRIRLVELVLELSHQIVLRVHDIQVLVLVPVPFVLLVLTGAADVIEYLPQFVTLGWSCGNTR